MVDLPAAEAAFVRCADYAALQLLHKLKALQPGSDLVKAEVAAYFHRFDEAEKIYLDNDRRYSLISLYTSIFALNLTPFMSLTYRDLALALRRKLGDWSRVAELQNSATSTDSENLSTYNQMGSYFGDRHQYVQASRYYELAKNNEKLVDCFYNMEDYEALEKLADSLDEKDHLLVKIAGMFTSVGLCHQAVKCYVKVGYCLMFYILVFKPPIHLLT